LPGAGHPQHHARVNRNVIRRTLAGAALGAALFGGVALLQALRAGAPFPEVLQPVLFFAALGVTVGGLAGPLLGQALANRKRYRSDPTP
jgi:hypothetical protein